MVGYGALYGGETARLLKEFGPAAVSALRENSEKLQSYAQIFAVSAPMRKAVVPYLDLQTLNVDSKRPFFGGRILWETTWEQFEEMKDFVRKTDCNGLFRMRWEAADNLDGMRKLLGGIRWSPQRLDAWRALCNEEEADALGYLHYPVAGKRNLTMNAMDRRAISRAELAFGEIAMRLLKQAGGELLVCSEGEVVFRFGTAEKEEIISKLEQTFAQKMLPFCEENAKMPKITVLNR